MRVRDPEEYKAVEAVLAIYCQEGAAANVEGVGKAFHEKAVMNGHGKDGYVFGSIQNFRAGQALLLPVDSHFMTLHLDKNQSICCAR